MSALRRPDPLYLLSALAMLVSCYLLGGASAPAGGAIAERLPLLAWLSLYEFVLIGLAVALTRRGLHRDAAVLVVLETLFLVDATHVTGEAVAAAGSHWGLWGIAFVGVAQLKLAALSRGLRLRLRASDALLLGVSLALVVALPGALGSLRGSGAALDIALYAASWLVGLLVALEAMAARTARPLAEDESGVAAGTALGSTLRIALPLSLQGHVLAAHWLYDTPYLASAASAPLLALGVFVVRAPQAERATRVRAVLPLVAVLLSAGAPDSLLLHLGVTVSPLRATLVAAGLVYAYDYARHRQAFAAGASLLALLVAMGGHTFEASYDGWTSLSTLQWGRLWIVAAFGLLGAGARRSLNRGVA